MVPKSTLIASILIFFACAVVALIILLCWNTTKCTSNLTVTTLTTARVHKEENSALILTA